MHPNPHMVLVVHPILSVEVLYFIIVFLCGLWSHSLRVLLLCKSLHIFCGLRHPQGYKYL